MFRFPRLSAAVVLLSLLAAACAPAAGPEAPTATAVPPTPVPATPLPPTATPLPVIGTAPVSRVTVNVTDDLAVEVLAAGDLPDACTQISAATQQRQGAVFQVSLATVRAADVVCAQMLQPFEYGLSLNAPDLEPGTYTVVVNGVSAEFVIPAPAPEALPSTAIIQAYETDPVAADAQYKDQVLVIQGLITNINDVFGTQALLLRESAAETGLQCYLTDNADALKVKVGDRVVIEGRVRGGELGFFMVVDDCRVLAP